MRKFLAVGQPRPIPGGGDVARQGNDGSPGPDEASPYLSLALPLSPLSCGD
jgi:hypothetical protein